MNVKKFLSDVASSLGRETVVFLRGILLIPVITKLLGVEAYGVWSVVLGLTNIIASISSLNLSDAVVRYQPEESRYGQVFVDSLFISILSSAVAGILLLGTALIFPQLFPGIKKPTTIAMSVMIFAFGINQTVKSYPRALDKIKLFELFNTIQILFEAIALMIVFYVTRSITLGVITFAIISLGVNTVMIGYFIPFLPPKPDLTNFKKYLTFSLPIMPQTLSSRIIRNSDKYLVLLFAGPGPAGIYSIVVSISKMIENVGNLINPSLYPKVVSMWKEENKDEIENLYKQILRWFVIFGVPAVAGLSLIGPDLLKLLATESVSDSGTLLLPVVALSYLIISVSNPLVFILYATENTKRFMNIYVIGLLLNLVANLVLIPFYGVLGAVLATLGTYIFITVLIYKSTISTISYSIPLITVVRVMVSTAFMTIIIWLFRPGISEIINVVIVPPLGLVIYGITIIISGELRQHERQYIFKFIRKI